MNGMRLSGSQPEDHGAGGKDYAFIWNEYIDGVKTLNNIDVTVDPDSGKVIYYWGTALPVPALLDTRSAGTGDLDRPIPSRQL